MYGEMAQDIQPELKITAGEWGREALQFVYNKILDKDAVEGELARRKHVEKQHGVHFANTPRGSRHFSFGLAMLPIVVLRQVFFLQPPEKLSHVPVTVGLIFTAVLSGLTVRRSLENKEPNLAILFDLCCAGLAVGLMTRLLPSS
ncbi:hypothetical protein SCHPADRAFT_894160 [Schizopora paradoxa]|uniref:Uncharacterized protein n=1 Tax=Schizopora paradoxa TaxID=27342 RepID=A0A0H2R8D0_9AGAM|nr:hypothetical protein SCHPADRAFT_894160 [Schizopora paradoxa]